MFLVRVLDMIAFVESEQPDMSSQPPTSSQSDLDSELLQSADPSFYRQLEFQDETTAARTASLQGGLLRVSGGALAPAAKPQREHKSSSRPPSSDTRRGERKKRDQLIVIDGPNVARVREPTQLCELNREPERDLLAAVSPTSIAVVVAGVCVVAETRHEKHHLRGWAKDRHPLLASAWFRCGRLHARTLHHPQTARGDFVGGLCARG